jgi:ABC-type nitrate/sulfonate/bicarbonate transport system substrate-binding protein
VYFVDNINNYSTAINNRSILDGGILWEPQYHYILSSDYFKGMATTNELFAGHTCCVIAGYENYLKNHSDETVRFLAAYIKAVDYINEAKDDPTGTKYANLVAICKDNIHGLTEEVIKEALEGVVYTYSDNAGTADLNKLINDIGTLSKDLTNLGGIKVKLSDLGFVSYDDLASAFVDNSYLQQALTATGYSGNKASITVAAIDGDIHQIAVQVAKNNGYFEEYGLDVTIKALPNGGGVAQDLLSGQSDLGFMGAPPITSATINAKKIKLVEGEE